MKKTIKLTESELVGIIKKVLNEYADIKNTKVGTNNKGHLTVGDKSYKITVKCSKNLLVTDVSVYEGGISVSKIWKSKTGGIAALDNTDKQFTLDKQKSEDIVTKMNRGDSVINTTATGKIAGISGFCKAKLTKS